MLADHARASGARVQERTSVSEALTDERSGRVVGVRGRRGPEREPVEYRAPLVVACDGVGARTALSRGIAKRDDRPLGVAVRRYYTSPRTADDYLETHLEVWDHTGEHPRLLPGYGWVFGMGDGTANVGLGILSTANAGSGDYRGLLRAWAASTPEHWGLREENAAGAIGGAALPMGLNRTPGLRRGSPARRGLRRDGQPVQRRGHLLRDAVGHARRRRRHPGPGPARGPQSRARSGGLSGRRGRGAGQLLPPRQPVRPRHRAPDPHAVRDAPRAAAPAPHGLPAQAARGPSRPSRRRPDGPCDGSVAAGDAAAVGGVTGVGGPAGPPGAGRRRRGSGALPDLHGRSGPVDGVRRRIP